MLCMASFASVIYEALQGVVAGFPEAGEILLQHDGLAWKWLGEWRGYDIGEGITYKTLHRARTLCAWLIMIRLDRHKLVSTSKHAIQPWTIQMVHDFLLDALLSREAVNNGQSLFFSVADKNFKLFKSLVQFQSDSPRKFVQANAVKAVVDLAWLVSILRARLSVERMSKQEQWTQSGHPFANFVTSLTSCAIGHCMELTPNFFPSSQASSGSGSGISDEITTMNATHRMDTALICQLASAEALAVRTALARCLERGKGSLRCVLELFYYITFATGLPGNAGALDELRHIGVILFPPPSQNKANQNESNLPVNNICREIPGKNSASSMQLRRLRLHPLWSRPIAAFFLATAHNHLRNLFLLDVQNFQQSAVSAYFLSQFPNIPKQTNRNRCTMHKEKQQQIKLCCQSVAYPVAFLCVNLGPFLHTDDVLNACLPISFKKALNDAVTGSLVVSHNSSVNKAIQKLATELYSFMANLDLTVTTGNCANALHDFGVQNAGDKRQSTPKRRNSNFFTFGHLSHNTNVESAQVKIPLSARDRLCLFEGVVRYLDLKCKDAGNETQKLFHLQREIRMCLLLKLLLPLAIRALRSQCPSLSVPEDFCNYEQTQALAATEDIFYVNNRLQVPYHTTLNQGQKNENHKANLSAHHTSVWQIETPIMQLHQLEIPFSNFGDDRTLKQRFQSIQWCYEVSQICNYDLGILVCVTYQLHYANFKLTESFVNERNVPNHDSVSLSKVTVQGLLAAQRRHSCQWFEHIIGHYFRNFKLKNEAAAVLLRTLCNHKYLTNLSTKRGITGCSLVKKSTEYRANSSTRVHEKFSKVLNHPHGLIQATCLACLPHVDAKKIAAKILASEFLEEPKSDASNQISKSNNNEGNTYINGADHLISSMGTILSHLAIAAKAQQSYPRTIHFLRQSVKLLVQNSHLDSLVSSFGPLTSTLLTLAHYNPCNNGSQNNGEHLKIPGDDNNPLWLQDIFQSLGQIAVEEIKYKFVQQMESLSHKLSSCIRCEMDGGNPKLSSNKKHYLDWLAKMGSMTTSPLVPETIDCESVQRGWGMKIDVWRDRTRQSRAVPQLHKQVSTGNQGYVGAEKKDSPACDFCDFCGTAILKPFSMAEESVAPKMDNNADETLVAYECGHIYHGSCDLQYCFRCAEI